MKLDHAKFAADAMAVSRKIADGMARQGMLDASMDAGWPENGRYGERRVVAAKIGVPVDVIDWWLRVMSSDL